VHLWLKYSVFLRLKNLDKRNIVRKINPELITFMVSAFWHGFYPNYYIAFFFAFEMEQISGLISTKTKLFEILENSKKTSNAWMYYLGGFVSNLMLNSVGVYFALTIFVKGNAFAYNLKFVPYILMIVVHAILIALPKRKDKSKETKKGIVETTNDKIENKVEETIVKDKEE
jgi:hypothetical protein